VDSGGRTLQDSAQPSGSKRIAEIFRAIAPPQRASPNLVWLQVAFLPSPCSTPNLLPRFATAAHTLVKLRFLGNRLARGSYDLSHVLHQEGRDERFDAPHEVVDFPP
jgi:hypothetical protein